MNAQILNETYLTSDYSCFKTLLGNREVTQRRVEKIMKSIENVGYITNPIVVNEKMEIIDGQGRFEALKALCLPIEYIVAKGCGIKECISMNINSTNWLTSDYIHSYAEQGVEDYMRLEDLIKRYDKLYDKIIIALSLHHLASTSADDLVIRRGEFRLSESDAIKLCPILEFATTIQKLCHKKQAIQAAVFCKSVDGCDDDRLIDVFQIYGDEFLKYSRVLDLCEAIEEKYNYRLSKSKRIFFQTEYKKYCLGSGTPQGRKMNK